MITIGRSVTLADSEVTLEDIRVRGVGGQHMNKVSTAIHLCSDIKTSSLSEFYKEHLLATRHHLIFADGMIVTKAQGYRSQEISREAVIVRLAALVKELTAM